LPESQDRRVTPEQVLEVLQTCYDPCCKERSVSVVELGLIQGVKVAENGHDVRIELLLTSGWCPFSTHLLQTRCSIWQLGQNPVHSRTVHLATRYADTSPLPVLPEFYGCVAVQA
jgi:metal-sulfur cluster biosynthetic enzyme